MLKITPEKTLTLYTPFPIASKSFLLALALASFLHLFGLLLFHITPLTFKESTTVLPPISIETVHPTVPLFQSVATADSDGPSRRRVPPPPEIAPLFPLPSTLSSASLVDRKIVITLSGATSDLVPISDDFSSLTTLLPEGESSATYSIRVDTTKGTLLWYAQEESYGDANITTLCDTILQSLLFHPETPHTILSGTITIQTINEPIL